jgi:hypothetical protein
MPRMWTWGSKSSFLSRASSPDNSPTLIESPPICGNDFGPQRCPVQFDPTSRHEHTGYFRYCMFMVRAPIRKL